MPKVPLAPLILQANHGNCDALLETLSHGRDMFREMCKYDFNEGKSKGGIDGGNSEPLAAAMVYDMKRRCTLLVGG